MNSTPPGNFSSQGGEKDGRNATTEMDRLPLLDALRAEGLEDMETYISRRQNMVAQFIETQPIIDLCLEAKQRPVSQIPNRCWDQVGLYSAGLWELLR